VADVPRVVLGLESAELAEEVLDFLDRSGKARVVATASQADALGRLVRERSPDAVIAHPSLVLEGTLNGSAYLALATSESVGALRQALRAGAAGFFLWPSERAELAVAAGSRAPIEVSGPVRRARAIAVLDTGGASGAAFLTAHLAAALARDGLDTVAVDLDPVVSELTGALGAPLDGDQPTGEDLAALAEAGGPPGPEEIEAALWRHPAGFRALLGPRGARGGLGVDLDALAVCLRALRAHADVVVVAPGRGLGPEVRAVAAEADRLVVATALDPPGLRAMRRVLDACDALGLGERCEVVASGARRSEVVATDVGRVAGRVPLAVLRLGADADRALARGELLTRGPLVRAVSKLAGALVGTASHEGSSRGRA
jgi:MinD-like ATPase involved in chromosome partitioning or flagellar assembly